MEFLTDKARRSAIDRIEHAVCRLANSDGAMKDLGYSDMTAIIDMLHGYQRCIEKELKGDAMSKNVKTTDDITIEAGQLDEVLSLHAQVKRFSRYDKNDIVDRAVAAKQVKAIERVMDILGIDYENASFNIIEGWVFE